MLRTHRVVIGEKTERPYFQLEPSPDILSEGVADVLDDAFLLRGRSQLVWVCGDGRASEHVGALPKILELVLGFCYERGDGRLDFLLQACLLRYGLIRVVPAPEVVIVDEARLLGVELVRVRSLCASDDHLERAADGGFTADALRLGFARFAGFLDEDGAGNESQVHCDMARSHELRQHLRIAEDNRTRTDTHV